MHYYQYCTDIGDDTDNNDAINAFKLCCCVQCETIIELANFLMLVEHALIVTMIRCDSLTSSQILEEGLIFSIVFIYLFGILLSRCLTPVTCRCFYSRTVHVPVVECLNESWIE